MRGPVRRLPLVPSSGVHRSLRTGLGLVEALIGAVLVALLAVAFYVGVVAAMRDARSSQRRLAATLAGAEYLELSRPELGKIGPRIWRTEVPLREGFVGRLEAQPRADFPGLRQVMLSVRWADDGGPTHSVSLGCLVREELGTP